ncbi:MAG: outer membrane protein, partial [Variibacter sp.]|nr:outer membrane protein [Variibacter sp.]
MAIRPARSLVLTAVAAFLCVLPGLSASAETLPEILVRTYQSNPEMAAERARLRGTDENIPQALAGYRPQIAAGLSAGIQGVRNLLPGGTTETATLLPWQAGLTINQNLFNGFKTANTVRQSEAQVRAGRETLRNVEQNILLDAVTAYMDVLSFQSLAESQRVNVNFLRETLGTTRRRLEAGDVTPTDVAQGEARLARATADLNNAEVNMAVARAALDRITASMTGKLAAADPVDRILPAAREEAIALARREHPALLAATYNIDVAQFGVSIAQSGLYPTVNVQGSISRSSQTDTTLGTSQTDQASLVAQANVPIYDGGVAASQTRQAKEGVNQSRAFMEQVRKQTEAGVSAAWVTHQGARVSMTAAESEVRAATVALAGVQKEAQAG